MSGVQKKQLSKRKILIITLLIIMLFSVVRMGKSLASTKPIEVTNVEVASKTDTTEVNSFSFEEDKVVSNVTFHSLGDSVTYRLKIKNNDEQSYTIKSISDDNANTYISYVYDSYEGTKIEANKEMEMEITEKYTTLNEDASNREQNNSVIFSFVLEDEQGNVIDNKVPMNTTILPITGDNIGVYVTLLIVSTVFLYMLLKKRTVKTTVNSRNRNNKVRNNGRHNTNSRVKYSVNNRVNQNINRSRSNKGKHRAKHGGKGFKIFSILILCLLILPTITKAVSDYSLQFTFENTIQLKDKLKVTYMIGDELHEEIIDYNGKLELEDPVREGYTFDGWTDEDGNEFDFDKPITDDITIVPNFTPIEYTIDYDLGGGENGENNPDTFTVENEDIHLENPTKEGHSFIGWTGTDLEDPTKDLIIPTGTIGNKEYEANWEVTTYNIEYILNGGEISEENPTTYTINSDNITLNNPTKEGYTFEGWTGSNGETAETDVTIPQGSTGDKEYTANWTPIEYTLEIKGVTEEELGGIENPITYTVESDPVTIPNPSDRKDDDGDTTEKFVGWKIGDEILDELTIPTDIENIGDGEIEAVWETVPPTEYTVEYDLDGGTVATENRTTFTKFDTFTLNNPTKENYDFIGWTGSNGNTPEIDVTIPTGTRENLNYTANWEITEYTIEYVLNSGTVTGNPVSYTVESESITLNNPTREGYEFKGWSGTGLTGETNTSVTIPTGSTGDREYTANFTAIEYTIEYSGLTEEEEQALGNPTTYTVETESKVLSNPEDRKDDDGDTTERFVGWKYGESTSIEVTIPPSGLGDKKYEATWETVDPNVNIVTYNLDGGTVETENRTTFTKFDTFTLNNPTKEGYRFVGWTGSNGETPELEVTIPTGIREDLTFTANWEEITYTIEYNLNEGTLSEENQTSYTINSDDITFNNPTREGYTFKGWTGTDLTDPTENVTIVKGSTGDREYEANWEVTTYTIVYNLDGGVVDPENPTSYTMFSDDITLNNPTKEGYTFKGWSGTDLTGDDNTSVTIAKGSTGNRNYTANFIAYTYYIKFNPNGGTGSMSDQTMNVDTASSLTANSYTRDGFVFKEWNTASNGTGESYDNEEVVCNLTKTDGDTVNLYAQWLLRGKYAVQIYGINQDEDANGNTLGLTFGYADGADYNDAYVTHEYEETSSESGIYNIKIITHTVAADGTETTTSEYLKNSNDELVTRTQEQVSERENISLHDMSWAQIKAVSDKTVFEDCMLCGDTKSVVLDLNKTIGFYGENSMAGINYKSYVQNGDGSGTLYGKIKTHYLRWNPNQSQNSYVGTGVSLDNSEIQYGSNAKKVGGYSSSHIRATLIGKNEKTNEAYAGNENLTEETCLFSCIEDDLKAVITPKKIKYVTGTSDSNYTLHDDIADSIWLFSDRELYGSGQYRGNEAEGIGSNGDGYLRFSNPESKYYSLSNSGKIASTEVYTEAKTIYGLYWLRSIHLVWTSYSSCGEQNGGSTETSPIALSGLSFGFCID